jgi:glycosyltransferase involved in cell wall biosynthesis
MATRILYVITKANWGGAQRYVYDLATAAEDAGYEVMVAYGEPGLLTERLKERGIRTITLPTLGRDIRPWKDLIAYQALKALFKKERPDIVHLNSSKAGFIGARAARAVGIKKIIFTAHGWAFTEPTRSAVSRHILKWLQYQTVLLSTKVIAVSEYVLHAADRWKLPPGRIELIRLGIRQPSYLSREVAREALIKIDPSLAEVKDEIWIGTIAELHKNKGIDIGIGGWKKAALGNIAWIVMGGGEEKRKLLSLAQGISTIHLLDFVPNAAQYLKAFDLFLLPSRTEALAYVILEAGLAGVPVITNGVGGTGEAVPPEYTPAMAFFEPENPDSLAKMLSLVIQDRQNLERVGQNLTAYVQKKFSFEKMISETLSLYKR